MIRGGISYGHSQLRLRQLLVEKLARQGPEIHEEIGEKLNRAFYVNHANEGSDLPVGRWPPLAKSTVRRKKFYKDTKLHETGWMKGAWLYNSSARGARIWNQAPYALYHQTGTRTMPARKLIPPKSWLETAVRSIVQRYFGIALGSITVRGRGI